MLAIQFNKYRSNKRNFLLRKIEIYLFSITLLFATGCNWFDGSSSQTETQPPPPPAAVAPTAAFELSVESGKAELVVDFTDTSNAGTSSISSWQWDFGDGGTSSEQNPQYVYQSQGVFYVSLTVSSADGSDALVKQAAVAVEPADIEVKVTIVDSNGALIEDVGFNSNHFQLEDSQQNDSNYQIAIRPSDAPGTVHISKPGYLKHTLYFESLNIDQQHNVTLVKKTEPIIIDAFLGGSYSAKDGASVAIPSQSLVDQAGVEVIGDVELYITPIDVSDAIEINGFPGSFFGVQQVGDENQPLFSYGVVDITFEQNGEELQLKQGAVADLNLPLYATKSFEDEDLEVGDTVPLWYLDEDSGLWIYENEGTVVSDPVTPNGIALAAQTTHFTAFNVDINPPGLAGGGSTGNSEPHLCDLTLNILGAEIGETYLYSLIYSGGGRPPSRNTRAFVFDGSAITQRILTGFNITATVSKGNREGTTQFSCNTQQVNATITLGEQPPAFVAWSFRSEPVFTRPPGGQFEVASNTVYLGGFFVGADLVTITSEELDTPLILGRGIFHPHQHESNDPEQISFHSFISNDVGSAEANNEMTYIATAVPLIGYAFSYYDSTAFVTHIEWHSVQGADTIKIYALGEDVSASGTLVAQSALADDSYKFDLAGQYTGFLRLEFENQYGTSSIIIKIGEEDCPPETDLC